MKKKYNTIEEQIEARLASHRMYAKTDKAKETRRKNKVIPEKFFIAWDGEGWNNEGEHLYTLLANSVDFQITNPKGLSTLQCLNVICNTAKKYPGSVHVIFAGSYDCNMILKDLSRKHLERLHASGKTYWKNFSIEYHPKKFLTVKRYENDVHFIHKNRGKSHDICTIWDVWGFFGTSFLEALKSFLTEKEQAEYQFEKIAEGKQKRGSFDTSDMNYIIEYNKLELKALVKMIDRLYNEYCRDAHISLKRFDGAGALAKSILFTQGVKKYYGTIPENVMQASQYAYGGGRIELLQFGRVQEYENIEHENIEHENDDICSAYPTIYPLLPELVKGVWKHFIDNICFDYPFSLYKIIWDYSETDTFLFPFYPFFYRSFKGDITYPQYGMNWVWYPELKAAIDFNYLLKGKIDILEQWAYIPGDDTKPFAFVKDMYEIRKKLKQEGNGMQLVYKLGYNSFYGATVQHLGYEEHKQRGEKNWRPPFYQLQYGGYITSATRAKLFQAGMQAPERIIGFATDGIFTTKHLLLDYGNNLGQWECNHLENGTYVQSGVYWYKKRNGEEVQHYRGFDRGSLSEQAVLDAWEQKQTKLSVNSTRFVTLGLGLQLKDFSKWHTWDVSTRDLYLYPKPTGKRLVLPSSNMLPFQELVKTQPNNLKVPIVKGMPQMSEMFPLPWSHERTKYDDLRSENTLERMIVDVCEEKYME